MQLRAAFRFVLAALADPGPEFGVTWWARSASL